MASMVVNKFGMRQDVQVRPGSCSSMIAIRGDRPYGGGGGEG